jgi:hypothetical protein
MSVATGLEKLDDTEAEIERARKRQLHHGKVILLKIGSVIVMMFLILKLYNWYVR